MNRYCSLRDTDRYIHKTIPYLNKQACQSSLRWLKHRQHKLASVVLLLIEDWGHVWDGTLGIPVSTICACQMLPLPSDLKHSFPLPPGSCRIGYVCPQATFWHWMVAIECLGVPYNPADNTGFAMAVLARLQCGRNKCKWIYWGVSQATKQWDSCTSSFSSLVWCTNAAVGQHNCFNSWPEWNSMQVQLPPCVHFPVTAGFPCPNLDEGGLPVAVSKCRLV